MRHSHYFVEPEPFVTWSSDRPLLPNRRGHLRLPTRSSRYRKQTSRYRSVHQQRGWRSANVHSRTIRGASGYRQWGIRDRFPRTDCRARMAPSSAGWSIRRRKSRVASAGQEQYQSTKSRDCIDCSEQLNRCMLLICPKSRMYNWLAATNTQASGIPAPPLLF